MHFHGTQSTAPNTSPFLLNRLRVVHQRVLEPKDTVLLQDSQSGAPRPEGPHKHRIVTPLEGYPRASGINP
jgi:hypothetical protein